MNQYPAHGRARLGSARMAVRAIGLSTRRCLEAWRLVWVASRWWTLAWVALMGLQALVPPVTVYLTKLVVDGLVAALGSNGAGGSLAPAFALVGAMALLMLLTELAQALTEWVQTAQSELVQDHVKRLIHEQSVAADLAIYESPSYQDSLEKARGEGSARPLALLGSIGGVAQAVVALAAMGAVVMTSASPLAFLLLVGALPPLGLLVRVDRRYHRWWDATTTERRRVLYYDQLLTSPLPAAELRLFGLGPHFIAAYQAIRTELRSQRLHLRRQQSLAKLGVAVAGLLFGGLGLAWMVWQAVHGHATLGDVALFYQALQRSQVLVRSLLGSLGQVYSNTLFFGDLLSFFELKPQLSEPARPVPPPPAVRAGITVRNVTFRYPDGAKPALSDLDFTVPAGSVAAIVGPNGAGKTTLLKLLCRLYDPQQGEIRIDGIDIRQMQSEALRSRVSVLFQFPTQFFTTVSENIALGNLVGSPTQCHIEAAARHAGAHDFIVGLPRGYETVLGRWLSGGAELSGGQWQRLATARAYVRPAQILVLDEPTSLMDSWAEAEWFDNLRATVHGATALVITHRFSIAMRADVIHVMDEGRIVESGTHDELLGKDGLYARSWQVQMQAGSTDGVLAEADPKALTINMGAVS